MGFSRILMLDFLQFFENECKTFHVVLHYGSVEVLFAHFKFIVQKYMHFLCTYVVCKTYVVCCLLN